MRAGRALLFAEQREEKLITELNSTVKQLKPLSWLKILINIGIIIIIISRTRKYVKIGLYT